MVKRCYADFKRSYTDTNDTERSGCPNSVVVSENTHKKKAQTKNSTTDLGDRKLNSHEIAEDLKISEGNVFTIFHEYLSMKKLCSQWVLCLLTVEQKQQRVDDSECCLQLFQRNEKEFLRKYVTIEETWVHHFTPEWNQQSAEWTATGENRPKRPKMQTSAGKVLVSVFRDTQGLSITLGKEAPSITNII